MRYDFDMPIQRRGTACVKWDGAPDGVIPMWIADMDFPCPDEVLAAVAERLGHPVLGYPSVPESCLEAIEQKMLRDHGWKIQREWITFCRGVVSGFDTAIRAVTEPGDAVVIQEPAYTPFFGTIRRNGREVTSNPLLFDGEKFRLDVDGLDAALTPRAKALLFCSPHNPTGRVWEREELMRVARICLERDAVILSDEIHCDIVFKPNRHIVLAALSDEIARRTITFMAPSKTFNMAGLEASVAIIPDETLRKKYAAAQLHGGLNVLAYPALEAAYRHGEDYRAQMTEYVKGNIDCFIDFIGRYLPEIKAARPEGTYLLWADMRGLGMNADELEAFLADRCRLWANDGRIYGAGGDGFVRFNLACPRSYVEEALVRLKAALGR